MNAELLDFIRHARQRGMDHSTIRLLLESAGWKERDIAEAIAAESLEVPIPRPFAAVSAREVFFYLLQATALYATVVNAVILYFNCINLTMPDPAIGGSAFAEDFARTAIRWSLATVLVSGPSLLFLTHFLTVRARRNPEQMGNPWRRWLAYLTLFAAVVAIMVDLITLLFYLLEGEITTRFLLKVVVLASVVAAACYYYLSAMRGGAEEGA